MKWLKWENIGFILIIINFFVGEYIPTSVELKWTIIVLIFVMAILRRLDTIEKKLESKVEE